jgi:hypothetical protein
MDENACLLRIALPRRTLSQLKKLQLFRRDEKPNFNLILLNCEEAIEITVSIFGYEEV